MACYHPLKGYRRVGGGISWTPAQSYVDQEMTVSCGQCIGCRLERSRQWAIRIMHEASTHNSNCFLTLTYDEEHLPEDGSLRLSDFQKFMKRLRRRNPDERIRYYHVGEYGDVSGRPHYHACVFGYAFPDRTPWRRSGDHMVHRSRELEELWPAGMSEIGELTFESAAYVARYVLKKMTGGRADEHYRVVDPETGEVLADLVPEYATMSRRPGIGADWVARWARDVYPADNVVIRGKPSRPPRYYDLHAQKSLPEEWETVSANRQKQRNRENETEERLHVREVCTRARMSTFQKRGL